MRILVTGAAGFIGSHVVARILDGAVGPFARLALVDLRPPAVSGPGVELIAGSFADAAIREQAVAGGIDLLFHIASVPGGAAEKDYALGRAVNLEGSLALLDAVADTARPPVVVYTSSIAAVASSGIVSVTADTPLRPATSYGAHKAMVEYHVADLTRRGAIDGRSVRPSGIVARPPASYGGFATAWMSDIFRALSCGRDFAVPTRPDAMLWLESVGAVASDILHAARIAAHNLPPHRAWTLPATVVRVEELAAVICAESGCRSHVSFGDSGFDQPALDSSDARRLGFRGDGDVRDLVRSVLAQLEAEPPSQAADTDDRHE